MFFRVPMFCKISPLTYRIAVEKNIMQRKVQDLFSHHHFAVARSEERLPTLVYRHASLIRRRLGNVDMALQENKATNLSLAAPHINGILIRPGEVFSFWQLVGRDSAKNGYKEGLTISLGQPSRGVGGGLCQFTNLIHWMILHSEMTIIEHHHHDGLDLFPDYNRQIPFGTGTSIFYNYRDYRFKNTTDNTYQLLVWTDEEYLRGELRAVTPQKHSFHVHAKDERFVKEDGIVYRTGKIVRTEIDSRTGNVVSETVIRENHAKVMYKIDVS